MYRKLLLFFILVLFSQFPANSQVLIGDSTASLIDYSNPQEYEIAAITVTGIKFLEIKSQER